MRNMNSSVLNVVLSKVLFLSDSGIPAFWPLWSNLNYKDVMVCSEYEMMVYIYII